MNGWVIGEVIQIKHWTKNLFSLIIRAPINPFIAGQFTRLALEINGERIQRAYSYVNAPKDPDLEFYCVTIPNGKFSTNLSLIKLGERIMVKKDASGFLILDTIPSCDDLWMLATGTAIGPYLSILSQGEDLDRFKNIILIHAVRFYNDFSYLNKISMLKKHYKGKLKTVLIVSREKIAGTLMGRIPNLIQDGSLESTVGLTMSLEKSHVMLCGNPNMVRNVTEFLKNNRGMRKHLKNKIGNISSEHYW
ncbi:ferredoxin--NADP(+) reductase [Candidatus Schneideria nysicola]|uniref:FAD-binding oxidoreductase n=1 Tax=Candidatus Schneideria nysicola TaxID=1081631 RepID=UPI001CAA60B2|nr:FAD-binding oxidoreductase [Candidatus Schneideria nysicola]UAJ64842.1 ferredoxin--NADP(+) reductase [Candidatus Schneideria nysicola]